MTTATATATKPKGRPPVVRLLFGHCATGHLTTLPDGRTHHAVCPGAGVGGLGQLSYCTCECHLEVPRCCECLQTDVELTLENSCIDAEACADRIESRHLANPIHVQIAEIRGALALQEQEEKAERAASQPPRPERARREPPHPQRCHCGCGGMTKGGRFVAGHDAKLKGTLLRYARGDTTGSNGTGQVKATAELIARDWPRKGIDTKVVQKADALVDEYGVDRVIELHVAARYGNK